MGINADRLQFLFDGLDQQFYIYDFSEMEPHGSCDMEFGEEGNYSPLPDIASYWRAIRLPPAADPREGTAGRLRLD
jgi:hypothetical protein